MSGHGSFQLQEAIYTALDDDASLGALITGIYDFVPQDEVAFPYITIGNDTAIDWSAKNFDGMEHTVVVDVWDQNTNRIPLKKIGEAVYNVLHNQTIAISGQNMVNIRCEFEQTLRDPDGFTFHLIQRYRVITTET